MAVGSSLRCVADIHLPRHPGTGRTDVDSKAFAQHIPSSLPQTATNYETNKIKPVILDHKLPLG